MKFFRSHIARLSGFVMLTLGMMLHYAKPAESKTGHGAFTSWLGTYLKTDNDTILNQIDALSTQEGELDTVIRKASELVCDHVDDVEIPIPDSEPPSEEEVYHLLLKEWNRYRNLGSGMGKAAIIENLKPHTILPSDGYAHPSILSKTRADVYVNLGYNLTTPEYTSAPQYTFSPLESGTAIGAP